MNKSKILSVIIIISMIFLSTRILVTPAVYLNNINNKNANGDHSIHLIRVSNTISIKTPTTITSWLAGSTHIINWTSTGDITNVNISLYYSGSYHGTIIPNTPNNGLYYWTLTSTYENYGDFYQIRIEDSSNSSTFVISEVFTIFAISVTSPAYGTSWEAGTTQTIKWIATESISNVNIKLYYRDFIFHSNIATNTPNDGSYSWTLPETFSDYGDHYKIRIEDASDFNIYDYSFTDFEIREADSDPSNDDDNQDDELGDFLDTTGYNFPGFEPFAFILIFGVLGAIIIIGYYRKFKKSA
ncbi:MAG: hypothetical protein JW891_16375 [Candidatus Lokiarchaeota archaeon]|nr:hypothetical protein [Candidatus Lokiarchaeota archaeon]